MFYVDRVRHKGLTLVERQFPSNKGWTEEKLKCRQSIEVYDRVFGVGLVLKPLREHLKQSAPEEKKINVRFTYYQKNSVYKLFSLI